MSDDVGLLRLLDALSRDPPYDPRCERIETAVKAVWLLWQRAKWDLLLLAGLPRAEFEPIFLLFDDLIEHHHLDDEDADQFIRFVQGVRPGSAIRLLSAALWMVGKYRQRKLTYVGVQVKGDETDG